MSGPTTLGGKATLACIWEATAPKPGNVYRGADFQDLTYADFLLSSVAIGPVFDLTETQSVGQLILAGIQATRSAVATNTNLGTLLLLAPLAKAAGGGPFRPAAVRVASETTLEDARLAYEAIRIAMPGGLGETEEADVANEPEITLYEAMRLAEERDTVARQFSNGFSDVFAAADKMAGRIKTGTSLANAIVWSHLELMHQHPDSLIARKCGGKVARQAADRAGMALEAAAEDGGDLRAACAELDFWLRADGHRRNPGTTADLIAAALFTLLIENRVEWPVRFYSGS